MTPAQINGELVRLRQQVEPHEMAITKAERARRAALAAEYQQADVDEAQDEKDAVGRRLMRLQDRISALEAQLPSQEKLAEVRAEVRGRQMDAQAASDCGTEIQPRLLAALEAGEIIARELLAARRDLGAATARLADIKRAYGLDISIPRAPQADILAQHLAILLFDVCHGGEPRETVERFLQNARTVVAEVAPLDTPIAVETS